MENKVIENYKIISLLGKGGMGTVYKAYDTKLERYVAIKFLNSQIVNNPHFVERFKREAKHQAQLVHPNIATVYGFLEHENLLGIVMEFVEGESLEDLIFRQGKVHVYDAVFIIKQIIVATGYAHSKGFIHRDIKPSNIIFNVEEGFAKIMDFGISKSFFDKDVTQSSAKVGTILYMSPEQIKNDEVTQCSDIYSLGITFYEMLKGSPPFNMESEYEIMESHLKREVPRLAGSYLPLEIDMILAKALAKAPNQRYQSCESFLQDFDKLNEYLETFDSAKNFKKGKKKPLKKIYSIMGFLLFVVVIIGFSYLAQQKVDQMFRNNELDKFKKYSYDVLFEGEMADLGKLSILRTGTKSSIEQIKFVENAQGFALCKNGFLLTTIDGGKKWQKETIDSTVILKSIFVKGNGDIFVAGEKSTLFVKRKNSSNWEKKSIAGKNTISKIFFVNNSIGFLIGSKGLIMKTTNGGDRWRSVNSNTSEFLYDIAFSDENICFAVGWNGVVLKSGNMGESWSILEKFTDKYLKSICFKNNEEGLVVGASGTIFKTSTGGRNWTEVEMKEKVSFQKVIYDKGYFIVIGDKGKILVSKNEGATWNYIETKTYSKLNDAYLTPEGNLYVSGFDGVILNYK